LSLKNVAMRSCSVNRPSSIIKPIAKETNVLLIEYIRCILSRSYGAQYPPAAICPFRTTTKPCRLICSVSILSIKFKMVEEAMPEFSGVVDENNSFPSMLLTPCLLFINHLHSKSFYSISEFSNRIQLESIVYQFTRLNVQ